MLSLLEGLVFQRGCGVSYGKPGECGWVVAALSWPCWCKSVCLWHCSSRPQPCRLLPGAHSRAPAALLLSQGWRGAEPSMGSCLWGRRAQLGWLCLQSRVLLTCWGVLVTGLAFGWNSKQKNLCGRNRITQGLSSITLARRVWGVMSGLLQFKVLWGQSWESLTRGPAFGASQV